MTAFFDAEIEGIEPLPYSINLMKKGALIAHAFPGISEVDGSECTIYEVGVVTLVPKKGVWIKFTDGKEYSKSCYPSTYNEEWLFVKEKDEEAI